jgi:hypothetical protein
MSLDNLSVSDQTKVRDFVDKGVALLQEIDDLKGGLTDLSKNLAEEVGTKPKVLMKALRAQFKTTLDADKAELDDVETVLQIANKI